MTRFRLTTSIIFILVSHLLIFSNNKLEIIGSVYDSVMRDPLIGATVRLLNANDSSFVCGTIAESILNSNGVITKSPEFSLTVDDRNKNYIMSVSFPGFETFYKAIDMQSIGKNQYILNLGQLRLAPESKRLNEVTVTATKIKFYNRGDTLVYNADAFNLAEGSMLDALIRQLPDVRLTQQGEIFVAGDKVESLLLNGKDFFKGNNQIMLDNLGAYMVKNVEVYKKGGFESDVAGHDTGDKQLVMDVVLKKEFMVGLIGNVEAGYGTDERYMARLFTGAFTKNSRLAIYANVNNVNSSQTPQPDSDWRPETMPTGTRDVAQGGIKFWHDTDDTKWSIFTGNDFLYSKENDGTDIYRTNFLNSGNTYENSFSHSKNKVVEVKSINTISFKNLKGYGFQFMPEGSYSHWDRNYEEAMTTLNEKIDGLSSTIIRNIYDGEYDDVLKYMINRDIELSKLHGHAWNVGGTLVNTLAIPKTSDQLTIRLYGKYESRKDDRFERFDINYGADKNPAVSANRYYKNYPDFKSNIFASAKYLHFFNKETKLTIGYEYEHNYTKNTSELYRLDMLDDIGEDFFGTLPSAIDYRRTLDVANSYLSRMTENVHRVIPRIDRTTNTFSWWCELPVKFSQRSLHYLRGQIDARISRRYVSVDYAYFGLSFNRDKNYLRWEGTINSYLPNLVNMVDMTDTTDPLNITIGNPDIKQATDLKTNINFRRTFRPNSSLFVKFEYQELFNGIAAGYSYDSFTGVRTTGMYNVDGNRSFKLNAEYNTPLGKIFNFRNAVEGAHITSVDLVGADSPVLRHNKVKTWDFHESLNVSANFSSQYVYLLFDGSYRRYSANINNFGTQNTWTLRTGVGAVLNLPFNFQISTDFSMYNRRGYTDNALNTDNFVWNARIAYKALKGSLLFMVDGYDMLKNISNVSYTINAQARTEMVRTVLPSYFMFHIQWRFNKQPKK